MPETYLNNWFDIIGFMDEFLFVMKQMGFKFIDSFIWITQKIKNGALFWMGKSYCSVWFF